MRHENESWRNASTQQKAREVAKSEVKTHWSEANEHFIDKNEKKKKWGKMMSLSRNTTTLKMKMFFSIQMVVSVFFSLSCCTPLISLAILTRVHLVSNLWFQSGLKDHQICYLLLLWCELNTPLFSYYIQLNVLRKKNSSWSR